MNPTSTASTGSTTRPEDERLPLGATYAYGIQHILTMYGGVIAPPLIIGGAAGLKGDQLALLVSAALFVSGLATILQSVGVPFFGSKLPLVQGISFASVSTLVAIATGSGGMPAVFGSIIVAGLVGLAITPFFAQVVRLFPPVVNGTIITVIGLSLLPVAVGWITGNDPKAADYESVGNVALGAFTLVVILVLSRVLQGAISRLSILLGIVIGTIGATIVGKADFSAVGTGSIVAFPKPFSFGAPTFHVAAIVSMVIVILVIMTETTADILAVGEIVGTEVTPRRVGDGLRADMLASAIAPVFNSVPATAFAQNVGVVAITGIKSRFVVTAGGSVLVVLGLLPVLGRVVAAVPLPVLGGAGIVLFGSVAASGIRTLSKVSYDGNLNIVLVATSIGFGMIPIVSGTFYSNFPQWVGIVFSSGISAASIMAVLLNVLFNEVKAGNRQQPSVVSAAPPLMVTTAEADALRDHQTIHPAGAPADADRSSS
jgi:xanthine permease